MTFAPGEKSWTEKLGNLRNVVRQELVTRQLTHHLPQSPARILDVGCGQGTQALRAAAQGHHVTALDASEDLLALMDAAREPGMDLTPVRANVEDIPELFRHERFDVVLCHGVLMYFADPDPLLRAIAGVLAPGGMLSLLVRNGDALAMRPGLFGDWATARQAFAGGGYTNRIGVQARADRREELAARLAVHDLEIEQWYGVRVFTDTAPDDAALPDDLDELLDCEELAGRTDPYRKVAALTHLVVR